MDPTEVRREEMNWIYVPLGRDERHTLVYTVRKFWIP